MSGFALALAAEAAVRAASLNLCTDELLLALADPRQIVSVSHLSHDPAEYGGWRQARRFPANDGSLESVVRHRPTLLLTMGTGKSRPALARRLGVRTIDVPFPSSPGEVVAQAGQVAQALGRPGQARPLASALAGLRATRPPLREGAFVSGGGLSIAPRGLSARWLALAGFRQPALPGARLGLERLATAPPEWLIRSDYRAGQASRAAAWLAHPLVRRRPTLVTDGRAWTCGGIAMLAEIARLRRMVPR